MVHGNPTWSFFFRHLITPVAASNRVIAPDHIGCGLSDKPQRYPYTLETHINNLATLIDTLGLEDITLVVHDWGGAIGKGYAVRNPGRIHSMVVMNTAAFAHSRIPARIAVCRLPVVGPLLLRGANAFCRAALFMATAKGLTEAARAGYLHPYDSWGNRVAVNAFVRDIPMRPSHPSWPTLAGIDKGLSALQGKPMLIVWGLRDFCFNNLFFDEWRRRFPDAASMRINDAGHYLLDDAHREIAPVVGDFLEQNR